MVYRPRSGEVTETMGQRSSAPARGAALVSDPRRKALIRELAGAESREEVAAARAALNAWFREHPHDVSILNWGTRLAHRESLLAEEAASAAI